MTHSTSIERDAALPAFPSLRAAAEMVGVNPSSLQRRTDLDTIQCGRERRIDPMTVLRLVVHYGNRSVPEAANDLVAHAMQHAPAHVERIEELVDDFMRQRHAERVEAGAVQRLTIEQILDELAPYIREGEHQQAEQSLRRAASQ